MKSFSIQSEEERLEEHIRNKSSDATKWNLTIHDEKKFSKLLNRENLEKKSFWRENILKQISFECELLSAIGSEY